MNGMHLSGYVLSDGYDLQDISDRFDLFYERRNKFILIDDAIKNILMTTEDDKSMYLFAEGNAVFVNCSPGDVRKLIAYLEHNGMDIDSDLFSRYYEEMNVSDGLPEKAVIGELTLNDINQEIRDMLAHMVNILLMLKIVEGSISIVHEKGEFLLDSIQRRKFHIGKRYMKNYGMFLKGRLSFGMRGLPETPAVFRRNERCLNIQKLIEEAYNLPERVEAIHGRQENLDRIIRSFNEFAKDHEETFSSLIVCWLLVIFIAMDVVYFFF